MGKTSLILSVLNDLQVPYLYLDMRKFAGRSYIVYKDFIISLEEEINSKIKKSKMETLKDFLKGIRGVKIEGLEVSFSWGKKERTEFSSVLDRLNEWAESRGEKLTIVIDEAQELTKLSEYSLLPSLAYAYDHLRHLNFIITGSEIRVFDKFLKVKDPKSPLYGRARVEIVLNPFDKDTSTAFLKRGFEEQGIEFKNAEEVYDELGGNPGWLTYYGYTAITKGFEGALERAKEEAKRILKEEFENFLKEGNRLQVKDRYVRVITKCYSGCRWSEIKSHLEALEGRKIHDNTVKTIIDNLIEYSFFIKTKDKYELADKLLAEALTE